MLHSTQRFLLVYIAVASIPLFPWPSAKESPRYYKLDPESRMTLGIALEPEQIDQYILEQISGISAKTAEMILSEFESYEICDAKLTRLKGIGRKREDAIKLALCGVHQTH